MRELKKNKSPSNELIILDFATLIMRIDTRVLLEPVSVRQRTSNALARPLSFALTPMQNSSRH